MEEKMEEKTSIGVCKINEWKGSSVWYRVECACGDGEDGALIDLSFDKDFGHINVNFYKNIMWGAYYQKKWWWQRGLLRIKMALQILFKGFTEHEGDFLIEGVDHLNDFITALQEGREKVLKFKEDWGKSKK